MENSKKQNTMKTIIKLAAIALLAAAGMLLLFSEPARDGDFSRSVTTLVLSKALSVMLLTGSCTLFIRAYDRHEFPSIQRFIEDG